MDHWKRIEAAVAGTATDRLPVALWRHFPEDDQDAHKLAARSIEWQRKWDFDLVKFMPSGTYGVEDWGARSVYEGAANGARAIAVPGLTRPEEWRRLARLDAGAGVQRVQQHGAPMGAWDSALRGWAMLAWALAPGRQFTLEVEAYDSRVTDAVVISTDRWRYASLTAGFRIALD